MQNHKEAQEGSVELNIGGYHLETSVQTLRRVPHTFFDAYFSGRIDTCRTSATMAASSWIGTGNTSGTSSNTCVIVWWL
jgi:hypothetical protein